jgi:hypothetical protein
MGAPARAFPKGNLILAPGLASHVLFPKRAQIAKLVANQIARLRANLAAPLTQSVRAHAKDRRRPAEP